MATKTKAPPKPPRKPKPGPIVCRPVGLIPLRDVPGFPPDAAALLADAGVVTLADLEPHVRETSVTAAAGGPVAQVREAVAGLLGDGLVGELAGPAAAAVVRELVPDCMAAAKGGGA